MKDNVISLKELKEIASEFPQSSGGGKLIATLLVHSAYEYGPVYARGLWKQSQLQWQQVANDDIKEFIQRYASYSNVAPAQKKLCDSN